MNAQIYSMVPLLRAAELKSLSGNPSAIGAYNVNFFAQGEGIGNGLYDSESPGIIQVSGGARKFQGGTKFIMDMIMSSVKNGVMYCIHLDHGDEKTSIDCIENGLSSVMIDSSDKKLEDNIALTKNIVDKAHEKGISVEGELGLLKGIEDHIEHTKTTYANPKVVPYFFDATRTDALAIAYGTSHGANKGNTDELNIAIPAESYASLKANNMNLNHFLVSHGSSTIPPQFVKIINKYGGKLNEKDTQGVPEYMLVRAICNGMRKINIDTDLRFAMTGQVRKWINQNQEAIKTSKRLELIDGIFKGSIKAYDAKTQKESVKEEITDPRTWLKALMDADPSSLREDYRKTNDEAFINLMELISDTVSKHVVYLNKVFGSTKLACRVEKELTLEEMTKQYRV